MNRGRRSNALRLKLGRMTRDIVRSSSTCPNKSLRRNRYLEQISPKPRGLGHEESLQTELQTNEGARHKIGHHKIGWRLDINWLLRRGWLQRDRASGPKAIRWRLHSSAERRGHLTANLRGSPGSLRIQVGMLDQVVEIVWRPRHFGGRQWYFICPASKALASVLWLPVGTRHFASGRSWKGQAAYASQFHNSRDRAISGARRIRTQLGGRDWVALDGIDPPAHSQ